MFHLSIKDLDVKGCPAVGELLEVRLALKRAWGTSAPFPLSVLLLALRWEVCSVTHKCFLPQAPKQPFLCVSCTYCSDGNLAAARTNARMAWRYFPKDEFAVSLHTSGSIFLWKSLEQSRTRRNSSGLCMCTEWVKWSTNEDKEKHEV